MPGGGAALLNDDAFQRAVRNSLQKEEDDPLKKQAIKNIQNEAMWYQDRIALKTLGMGDCLYYALAQQLIATNNPLFDACGEFIIKKERDVIDMQQVREDLEDHVKKNWKLYRQYVGSRSLKEFAGVNTGQVPGFINDKEEIISSLAKQGDDGDIRFLQLAADRYCCNIDFVVSTNLGLGLHDTLDDPLMTFHGTIESYNDASEHDDLGIGLYVVGARRHFVAVDTVDRALQSLNSSPVIDSLFKDLHPRASSIYDETLAHKMLLVIARLREISNFDTFKEHFAEPFLAENPETTPKLAASFIDRTLITCNTL